MYRLEYVHETIKVPDRFLAWIYLQSENHITQVAPHWHRSLELSYIIRGSCLYDINGHPFVASAGDIVLINSCDVHACETNYGGDSEMMSIIFPYEFLKATFPTFNDYRYMINPENEAYSYLREAFAEIYPIFCGRKSNPLYQIKLNGFFYSILYIIFTECKAPKMIPGSITSQKHMDRCSEILDYIDAHFAENITLESMAEHFSMSKEHLSRTFKAYMATTFKKYLTSIRIHHAYQDLIGSDLSILQIALDNGFSDARSFTNAFKSYYHETPQKYRKANNEPNYSHIKAQYLYSHGYL